MFSFSQVSPLYASLLTLFVLHSLPIWVVGTFTYVTLNIYGYIRSLCTIFCTIFVLMVLCGMNLFNDIDSLNAWAKSGHNPYMWPVVTWHHQIRHYCLETAQVTVCATVQLLWRRLITGVWPYAIYWCVVCGTVSRRDVFVKPHPTAVLWLTALTVWGSALNRGLVVAKLEKENVLTSFMRATSLLELRVFWE